MKTIIAGCRDVKDRYHIVKACLLANAAGIVPTEVVSGAATGVDYEGEQWANCAGIPVKQFPADWDRYGRLAGPIRNEEMAEYADALIAVWDGKSPGTRNMINAARRHNLKVFVYRMDQQ